MKKFTQLDLCKIRKYFYVLVQLNNFFAAYFEIGGDKNQIDTICNYMISKYLKKLIFVNRSAKQGPVPQAVRKTEQPNDMVGVTATC